MMHVRSLFVVFVLALAPPGEARADQQAAGLDPETRFSLALQHLREGRADTALEELRRAIKDDPKNPYFHKGLGMVHLQRREYGKAAEALRKALELNPYYADARNDLATALILDGKREEGKREYLAVFNDPTYNSPEVAARNLGQAYFEERNWEQALSWYRTAVQRNPKYPDAWLGVADVYVKLERLDEAAAQLEAALGQVGDALEVKLGFGEVCLRAGRLAEARQALEEVARKDPAGAAGRRAVGLLRDFPQAR